MKSSTILSILVIVIIVVGGFFLLRDAGEAPDQNNGEASSPIASEPLPTSGGTAPTPPAGVAPVGGQGSSPEPQSPSGSGLVTHTVTYIDSGYSPDEITISVGETVEFKNESSRSVWTATDIHPSHTVYPGSAITKCGGSEESELFDSCRGMGSGESYSFTFGEVGTWRYHDHLSPGKRGRVIVQ